MTRYEVNLVCPYCLQDSRAQVGSSTEALLRRGRVCPSCGEYQELLATFDGGELVSVVLSRALAPGTTLH